MRLRIDDAADTASRMAAAAQLLLAFHVLQGRRCQWKLPAAAAVNSSSRQRHIGIGRLQNLRGWHLTPAASGQAVHCVLPTSACAPADRASSSAQRSSLVRRRAVARSISITIAFSFSRFSLPSRSMAYPRCVRSRVFGVHLLNGLAPYAHVFADRSELGLPGSRPFRRRFVRTCWPAPRAASTSSRHAGLRITLGLAGLPLQRIHLPRYFVEKCR